MIRARGWQRTLGILLGAIVVCISCYLGLAIRYWIPYPAGLRNAGAIGFPAAMLALWFIPGRWLGIRRIVVAASLAAVIAAYVAKEPVDEVWVDLMARRVTAVIDGDAVTLTNFRDAIHRIGAPSVVRWTTQSFDLAQLEGADLIMQPFGNLRAMEHVMLSFGFADGRHLVVSMEARRTSLGRFDPLAGFFRHDQLYAIMGTERDLIWQRRAKTPPEEMQLYPIRRSPEAIRSYLRRLLIFANELDGHPRFYSTLRESCMTTLINIAPEGFASVKWYDIRRWLPGYSLSLFQQLGLVDDSMPADELAAKHRLRDDLASPEAFPSDAAWSAYLREQ